MPATRQIKEQARVKARILRAARRLFVKHGYEAVSLRRIAGAIGYTAPALYTHFASKEDLLLELCREEFAAFSDELTPLNAIADPVVRVYRFGEAYVRFAARHPEAYRFMFMLPVPPVEPEPSDLAKFNNPEMDGYAAHRAAITQAIEAGDFLPAYTDADLVAQVLWSGVHGLASLHITHENDPCVQWRPLPMRLHTLLLISLVGFLTPRAADRLRAAVDGRANAGGAP